ncbi:MAG: DUF2798 domain-containing protein [Rickettsiales bacterium]|nr:DUF2798 domain-containing protein [Rickettsiales bacterium]
MTKFIRFVPQAYMILCMTLSVTFIHYMLGHSQNFWASWLTGLVIAAPLAIFYSSWIGPIMRKLGAKPQR